MTTPIICTTCGACWTDAAFTADCPECGGGAMERDCAICGGACGNRWRRAVLDSRDSGEAHWVGSCGQSPDLERQG